MSNPSCLIDLKNILPKTSWPQVIMALRQDALIWQALQNPDFRGLAISKLGSHPEKWTPVQLALLALGLDLSIQDLQQTPLAELDPELRVHAIQTYEEHSTSSKPEMTLTGAGLLALALLEHFRLTQSWEKIPLTLHWQTPFTCLFGLLKKPNSLLKKLPTRLAVHTILANPLSQAEQIKTFNSILVSATNQNRLALIRSLALHRPTLASAIASQLWRGTEPNAKQDQTNTIRFSEILPTFKTLQCLSNTLVKAITHAEAQIVSGLSEQTAVSMQEAWQTASQLQTLLATHTAQITINQGEIDTSLANWEIAQKPPEIPAESTADIVFALLQNQHFAEAQNMLENLEGESHPAAQLVLASVAYEQGQEKEAQEAALQAAKNTKQLNPHHLFSLAKLLLDLRLPTEAIFVAEIARQVQPNNIALMRIAAQAHAATGAYPQAIQAIHLATAYETDHVEIQREFAGIHEYAQQWPAAAKARKNIIEMQTEPPADDLCALAKCALKLDQYQQALEACNAALEIMPNHGPALALLGEVNARMGNLSEAKIQLGEAIKFAPDQALPWLAMARFQQQEGNFSEATETLCKAAHASPEAAEIHLALGKDYLQAGSPSQALASLRKANQLAQSYPLTQSFHLQSQIAHPLAKTLFELGHAEEALQIVQTIHALPENQSATLHLQAQIYIFLGKAEQAIPLLAKALLENPSDSAICLDYAQAQLEAQKDPGKAIRVLVALLENDPENAEALAWLAEALKANGDASNALVTYRKALGTRLSEDPYWHPKLSIGLAQSALSLDKPETALAALQGSWQTSPQNQLKIAQTLAVAYDAAHLQDKALRTASSARDLEPHSVENLVWFADFVSNLQAYDEAINALTTAIELEPQRTDVRLQLGALHQQVGDIQEASLMLRSIIELDQATPKELREAAKNLITLSLPEEAIVGLKIAIARCQDDPDKGGCPSLLLELIEVYLKLGLHAEALGAINDFMKQQPEKEPALLGQQAIILSLLGRNAEAHTALEQALGEHPNSNPLHLAAAQIHYAAGELPKALEHAQMAIQSLQQAEETESPLPTLTLAADIAEAGLQSQITKNIMSYELAQTDISSHLDYCCLRAELALDADEEIDAAQALTAALQAAPDHPRVNAIQARLTARHGDGLNAQQILENALETWGELPKCEITSPAGILGIAEAALELHQWSTALFLLQEAADMFPQEPRTHLRLARGLVLRAEYQRLCETLRVTQHAPGASARSNFTYQLFEQAIMAAAQSSEGFDNNNSQTQTTHWRIRGQAIFQPSGEHARALGEMTHTPESRAALLAALRHSREKQQSKQTALEYFASASHHLAQQSGRSVMLMVQIALALSKLKPKVAANAAENALDTGIRQKHPAQPIFHAVQAFVAEQAGDFETASSALENALSQWTDEARWHVWAAETQGERAEPETEIILEHFARAIELEPKHGAHYLKLGQVQMEAGDPETAITNLEQAARLLSKQPEPWMSLARAYQATGEIAQIFHNAERAAELDPTNIEPYILLAESALGINNPEKTIEFCQSAFQIDPENHRALILNARALSMVGQSTEALQSFDQAIKSAPKSVSLMLEHAQLTQQAAGGQSAVKELQELSLQYPEDPRVLASLAKALISNDQPDPAIEAAQKALQTNQGLLDCTQESHLLETLGRLMRRNGQLDHAIHYLSEAIQCNPESIGSYLELGRVYQDRRQYAQALDVFQQAIALAPGNAHTYYQAGQTLKAAKDYAAAEQMLQTAAKLAPDDLAIRRQLGGLVALNLVHNRKNNAEIYVE